MNKFTKSQLTLKQFMLRQDVLKLYRDIFRTIRKVPDVRSREELKQWARHDFRQHQHIQEPEAIKSFLQVGYRSLKELQNSLELSDNLR